LIRNRPSGDGVNSGRAPTGSFAFSAPTHYDKNPDAFLNYWWVAVGIVFATYFASPIGGQRRHLVAITEELNSMKTCALFPCAIVLALSATTLRGADPKAPVYGGASVFQRFTAACVR